MGMISAHFQHNYLFILFLLMRSLLAIAVLLRCCLDSQVMGRIKRGYLKCEEVRDVYEADTAVQSRTTIYTSPAPAPEPATQYLP